MIYLYGSVFALIVIVTLWLFLRPQTSSYRAKEILKSVEPPKDWQSSFGFISNGIAKKYKAFSAKAIKEEIKDAGVDKTVEQVVVEQFVYAVGGFLLMLLLYILTESIMVFWMSFGAGAILFFEPRSELKRIIKKKRKMMVEETPQFVISIRLMLKSGFTPVAAIREACNSAVGDGLRPFTNRLRQDLESMHPADAIREFAYRTKVDELIDFANGLSQAIILGGKDGEEILLNIEQTNRALREKVAERRLVEDPKKLKMFNLLIMVNSFMFIGVALIMYIVRLFQKGGGGFGG